MTDKVLKTVGISKEFSGTRVLNRISVELEKGEIFGIIGENGAGKSTFIKILNGTFTPTEGKIFFEGEEQPAIDHSRAKKIGISTIPQEFNLIEHLNVFENIFLGQEYKKNAFLLDKKQMRVRTLELLKSLKTEILPGEKIQNLSVAQKQMVEIAKAVAYNCKLLIMDEPTTVLTTYEIATLFQLMRRLKSQGVTIIYISHKLREVKEICDRVMILRDGDFISLDETGKLSEQEMARRMVGRELNQMFPPKTTPRPEKVLQAENLSVPGLLYDISFDLHQGEILGFAGLNGAGRTELAETIMGIRRKSAGRILVRGKEIRINSPGDAVKNGLAYLPEDRQGAGILTSFTVQSNITLNSLKRYSQLLINYRKAAEKTGSYVEEFNIRTPSLETRVEYLSGGNQQKVSMAKSLDTEPEIFIFDEPARGIDVNAKMEIFRFIHQLVESGISCIFISSELEEIIGMCNRVMVMRAGRVTGFLKEGHIAEEEIMYQATGIKEGVG